MTGAAETSKARNPVARGQPRDVPYLAYREFSRLLRSPFSLYFFMGFLAFLAFAFWLFATFAVQFFLDLVYLMLPLFFLAPAATLISWDRQTGFAGILFTNPITAGRYYLAKFLSIYLVFVLYLLVLVPFDFLVVVYAGLGWVEDITRRTLWAILETTFATSLGLLLSASFGRRGALPASFLGFAFALALVAGPVVVPSYLVGLDPSTVNVVLALLHFSPLMAAMDDLGLHGPFIGNPFPSLAVTIFLTTALLLIGLTLYARFQSAEGWEVRRSVTSILLASTLALLVIAPLAPQYGYSTAPVSAAGGNCVSSANLEYCLFPPPGAQGDWGLLPLGSSRALVIRIDLSNRGVAPVAIRDLSIDWNSRHFHFDRVFASLGPVTVPASPGPNRTGSVAFNIPVNVTPIRAVALGANSTLGLPTVVRFQIWADGKEASLDFTSLRAAGPRFDRNIPWAVAGGMAVAALGLRFLGGMGRARR